jgi:hypothetical protein
MPDFTSGITCFYNGFQRPALSFQPNLLAPGAVGNKKAASVIKHKLNAER